MNKNAFKFSKLLKKITFRDQPSYVVEIINNNNNELYFSYYDESQNKRQFTLVSEFLKYNDFGFLFSCLPNDCIIKESTNLDFLFYNSPITHFEVDCPNLLSAKSMFRNTRFLEVFNSKMPMLENAGYMFSESAIENIENDFIKLKDAYRMFLYSNITNFNSLVPKLENATYMFSRSQLRTIKKQPLDYLSCCDFLFHKTFIKSFECDTPSLITANSMFECVSIENLKMNAPKLISARHFLKDSQVENIDLIFNSLNICYGFLNNANIKNITRFHLRTANSDFLITDSSTNREQFKKKYPYLFL